MQFRLQYIFAFLFFLSASFRLVAQSDTASKTTFVILDNEYSEFFQTKEGAIHQLVNHVKVRHGSDTLYCDSAILYQGQNRMDAIGNVAVFQEDGTKAFADYARYTGNDRTVYLTSEGSSDVQLSDNEGNSLWSKEVYYNLKTKIGYYKKDGILRSESTLIQSDEGTYNMRTKLSRFKGNVYIKDKDYEVFSEELTYQTDSKDVQFFAPSIIYSDSSIFRTSGGTYNELNKIGYFTTRSSLFNKEQYIEADTLYHNEVDSNSWAKGQVLLIDTLEKAVLYAGYAEYIGRLDEVTAFELPLLELLQEDKHSIFIKGDTFYVRQEIIVRDMSAQDLIDQELENLTSSKITLMEKILMGDTLISVGNIVTPLVFFNEGQTLKPVIQRPLLDEHGLLPIDPLDSINEVIDALIPDSIETIDSVQFQKQTDNTFAESQLLSAASIEKEQEDFKQFIIYPHPLIFSDSLQAKADSMVYHQESSMFSMFGTPIMWSNKQQITGEVIHITMDEQSIKEFHVPSLGIMIAINEPEEAEFFNQLQAQDIRGFFENNELKKLEAKGNATSIYYLVDEEDAYVGVSEATADDIELNMMNQEIEVIKYLGPTDQLMQPLHLANTDQKKLDRFIWRVDEKIESWSAFFEMTRFPYFPVLIEWAPLNNERWGSENLIDQPLLNDESLNENANEHLIEEINEESSTD